MARPLTGEVRRLSDAFPLAEVRRASKHLEDALQTQRRTLETLNGYVKDNEELSKLVQDLPNKVSYNIMVPFGKAAFFPGRLVHTNEYLVLLGEGYYSECSAKQTLEILNRRGKFLDTKIGGVNAQLSDLQAESLFFNDTLAEAAAGVVEIREDFVEPSTSEPSTNLEARHSKPLEYVAENYAEGLVFDTKEMSQKSTTVAADEDVEHERLMARLSELEDAEAAAEMGPGDDEEDGLSGSFNGGKWAQSSPFKKDFGKSLAHQSDEKFDRSGYQQPIDTRQLPEIGKSSDKLQSEGSAASQNLTLDRFPLLRGPGDLLKFEEWRKLNSEREKASQSRQVERAALLLAPERIGISPMPDAWEKSSGTSAAHKASGTVLEHGGPNLPAHVSKAFTGTVLEHSRPSPPPADVSQGSRQTQAQARPTSKFKMRQREK